jgi:acyl-CoA synthetase (AMP-forming)/AMP-acid ligase II
MTEDRVSHILSTLPAYIEDVYKPWAESFPDKPALVESSGTWTYRELALAVDATKSWLLASGVRPGDRVMIICENCRAHVAVFFALTAIGAWPVIVNARLAAREVDQIRDHSGARLVIFTTSVSSQAREHAKRHGASISEVAGLGKIGVGPLIKGVEPEHVDHESEKRIAALIYTSGTTGLPKGVMLTHKNLLFIAAISAEIRSLGPEDRVYGILPMSHAVGLSVVLLGSLLSGATLYLSPRFDPVLTLQSLEKDQLTVVLGVPSMFALLLEYATMKGLQSLSFPALRIISSSGAPLHQGVKDGVEKLFGMVLHNGYGVTETSPNIAMTWPNSPRKDTSVGPVFPGVEIALIGKDGQRVKDGEVGELRVRGPSVMRGYYRDPKETAAAIDAEGWFNTRDLARMEKGSLFILGRTKELIVRFGFNVYPAEVESVLNNHPLIVRSAVIGRTVAGDEEVIAFLQLLPDANLPVSELQKYAASQLAPYKIPSHFIFVPTMPVTATGKVVKGELAKILESSSPAS